MSKVLSINITATALVVDTITLPGSCRGAAYSQTLTASGGTPAYTWSIIAGALPTTLSLNTSSGEISGTVDSNITVQTYSFTVRVTDSGANTADRPLSIEVYPEPVWVTTTLPNGNISVPYSSQLDATFGDSYTLVGGTLPPGVTLSGSGLLSGTPTDDDFWNFTVRATSVHGCDNLSDQALSIIIQAAPPVLSGTFTNVCNGITYYNHLTVASGTAPFTYAVTAGSLPQALTLGGSSGSIQGITAEPGVFNFDITVTDSLSLSDMASFSFEVYDSPFITNTILSPGIYGRPFSHVFSTVGGTNPKLWTLNSRDQFGNLAPLPEGLVFNAIYGTITGTPTEFGFFNLNVSVQDANGCGDSINTYINIAGPPVVDTPTLPPACQGKNYSAFINIFGGIPPYYWFISSDTYPPQDLFLNPYTGELSGIPLIAGRYPFTIRIIDNNNLYVLQNYILTVRPTQECGQADESETVVVTKIRLASLESNPVIVQDPFHQKYLSEYLPVPFILDK